LQFLAGTYLFAGLTLFGTFKARPLYMAALAFTALASTGSRSVGTASRGATHG